MADIFISYAREDQAFVERLVGVLERLGKTVWWDRKIETGAPWEKEIERQLKAAKSVIVVWSPRSVESDYVRNEARRALRWRKLLPVVMEETELPLFSEGLQVESLIGWDGETSGVEFQDLWRGVVALTEDQTAASFVPRDGETEITPPPSIDSKAADDVEGEIDVAVAAGHDGHAVAGLEAVFKDPELRLRAPMPALSDLSDHLDALKRVLGHSHTPRDIPTLPG